jgi:catechol 2,3-dioxygenase-like lactoylglutathione lyase family enzyme
MTLNHINLGVTAIEPAVEMFETIFGLQQAEGMPFNSKMAFLIDDKGALLSLFKVNDVTYPKIFHIGFMQPNAEAVLSIREKLLAGGYEPEEAREDHGRFTFYFKAPGGFLVEVNTLL